MAIKIFSDGACFRIDNNQSVYYLTKAFIRSISMVRNDTLKIETGDEPLRNIYIPFLEVTEPVTDNIVALQSWLNDRIPVAGAGGNIDLSTLATEGTQLKLLEQLQGISALVNSIKLLVEEYTGRNGLGVPDLTDDTQPFTIYRGWAETKNADTSRPVWAIQRSFSERGVTEIAWADGNQLFDNAWDERYNLNYL